MIDLGPYSLDTIVVGDCLDVMRQMPDGCVDAVITDPPYGAKRPSAWRLASERFAEVVGNDGCHTEWIHQAVRVLADGGAMYVCTTWQVIGVWSEALSSAGLNVRSCIVWDKGIHGLADLATCWAPRHEMVIFAAKGRHELIRPRPVDIIRAQRVTASRLTHPYEKPVELPSKLLCHSSNPGDRIFDPFMGSGTTAVAAKKLGRHYFGCDISEEYVKMARERVAKIDGVQLELPRVVVTL